MNEADRGLDGAAELLQDVGRSGSRYVYGDDRDDELMRLSDAPLMIRDFLDRQDRGGQDMPQRLSDIPPSAALYLQQARAVPRQAGLVALYIQRERRLEPSFAPEAFRPSATDCSEAISAQLTALWEWSLSGLMRRLLVLIGLILVVSFLGAAV